MYKLEDDVEHCARYPDAQQEGDDWSDELQSLGPGILLLKLAALGIESLLCIAG